MTTSTDDVLGNILIMAARERVAMYTRQMVGALGYEVRGGPFAGTVLPDQSSWGDGDLATKLLGSYEAELHLAIAKAVERAPDMVINVGCAEGYYAIGLARLLPKATVHAFDLSADAQRVCAAAAHQNGVGERVRVQGECTAELLVTLTQGAKRALVVMDCEGAEAELLDAAAVARFGTCDVIVECHDFMNPVITPSLMVALSTTHRVETVTETARDGAMFPVLRSLNSLDRALMVNEFRPTVMNWLVAWSR